MFEGYWSILASFEFAAPSQKLKFGSCALTGLCSFINHPGVKALRGIGATIMYDRETK